MKKKMYVWNFAVIFKELIVFLSPWAMYVTHTDAFWKVCATVIKFHASTGNYFLMDKVLTLTYWKNPVYQTLVMISVRCSPYSLMLFVSWKKIQKSVQNPHVHRIKWYHLLSDYFTLNDINLFITIHYSTIYTLTIISFGLWTHH